MPLQSLKPELHDAMLHLPAVHAPVPLAGEHAIPQAPQFLGSVANPELAYSHPLAGLPSQSLVPGGQVLATQAPAVQILRSEPSARSHAAPRKPSWN